MKIKTRT